VERVLQDIAHGLRVLRSKPVISIVAVLSLGIGIGGSTAIFALVWGVMLKPLPYQNVDRIVSIWETQPAHNNLRNVISSANFLAWQERSQSFMHLGMVGTTRLSVVIDNQPDEITGMSASSAVFEALGVPAAYGRVHTSSEDAAGDDGVMVLSHDFWQSRLGGREIVGASIKANGRLRTVIGVMPAGFTIEGQSANFYVPYGWRLENLRAAPGRGGSHAIGRLKDDVSVNQASAELRAIAAQLEQEFPNRNTGWSVAVVPIQELTAEKVKPALLVISGGALLVLLVACVNVANLLLAHGTRRQRELAVRTALGAGRRRLVRQLMTENLVLAAVGGIAGTGVAFLLHRGLLQLASSGDQIPRIRQVSLDATALGFAVVVTVAASALFGLVPALLATGSPRAGMLEGGRHGSGPRTRRALAVFVVAEVALSLMLLTGAGLLVRSFVRLQGVSPGFRPDNVLTGRVSLPQTRYPTPASAGSFVDRALDNLAQIPGIESVAGISFLPMAGDGMRTGFYRADRGPATENDLPVTDVRPITEGFFRVMGIPHLAGRDFARRDARDAPLVAIVSQSLARHTFPGMDPLGQRLHVAIGRAGGMNVEIVGIVGDVKLGTLDADTGLAVYLPMSQLTMGFLTFVARTQIPPMTLVSDLTSVIKDIDPELPVADVRPMAEVVQATLARARALTILLGTFAVVAVALAMIGVYGVMSYTVSERTQEIGVRMALGATAASVFGLVLNGAVRLVVIGVATGLVASALSARVLRSLLFDTQPIDPVTFAATSVILISVAVLAAVIPARRSMRVAPTQALRAE
jgi:putative ABC transport system permease protein